MIAGFIALLAVSAHAQVVDRVVAVVEEQLVTASDVRLEGDLSQRDVAAGPFWSPSHGDPTHRLVEAAVVRQLAGDLALYRPSEAALGTRADALRAGFLERTVWEAFLTRHGVDEDGIRALLERRMIVEAYLARNIDVPVGDEGGFVDAVDVFVAQESRRMRLRWVPEVPR